MYYCQMQEKRILGQTSIYCLDFAKLEEAFDYIRKALDEGETDFIAISEDWTKLPAYSTKICQIKEVSGGNNARDSA